MSQNFGFYYRWGINWPAGRLSASKETGRIVSIYRVCCHLLSLFWLLWENQKRRTPDTIYKYYTYFSIFFCNKCLFLLFKIQSFLQLAYMFSVTLYSPICSHYVSASNGHYQLYKLYNVSCFILLFSWAQSIKLAHIPGHQNQLGLRWVGSLPEDRDRTQSPSRCLKEIGS
jgi:hypothetical protein